MSGTAFVVNRSAGGGRAGRVWERLTANRAVREARSVMLPGSAEDARAAFREALATRCDRIVVVGGDGSIHLAVNALLAQERAEETVLGVVPAGTGSDLARTLGLPRSPAEALEVALGGVPRRFDAGRGRTSERTFFFANIASAGLGGLVDEKVNAIANRGRTAFLRATLSALASYRCVPVRIAVDEIAWFEGPLFLLAVANGSTFGKGMRIAPRARPDDGWFDVVVVGQVGRLELLGRLPQVYLGRHLGAKPVAATQGRTVTIVPLRDLPPFDVDGETYASGAATFEIMPQALAFACPKGAE